MKIPKVLDITYSDIAQKGYLLLRRLQSRDTVAIPPKHVQPALTPASFSMSCVVCTSMRLHNTRERRGHVWQLLAHRVSEVQHLLRCLTATLLEIEPCLGQHSATLLRQQVPVPA
eukprot:1255943-Amphidinium_carterae.2